VKPTIQNISDPAQALKWTIVHAVIGAISAFTPWAFIFYFYLILFFNVKQAFSVLKKGNIIMFTLLVGYLQSFEQVARVSKSYPFVPSEFAKYISVLFGIYALSVSKRKSNPVGIAMFILITPAIFYDFSGQRGWAEIVNHFLSPFAVSLAVMLWGGYRPTDLMISRLMRLIWLGFVSVLISVVVKTPELETLNFGLEGNAATSGGASTNQISTILGFGMFLSFYSLYKKENFSGYKLGDMAIFLLFSLQTLLTFSRGGMIGGVLAILVMVFGSAVTSSPSEASATVQGKKKKGFPVIYLVVGVILLLVAFTIVDQVTGGKLSLRYQGETQGTVGGYAEKDINRFTSGRSGIVEDDIKVWLDNPVIGGGIGSSPYLRMRHQTDGGDFYITPHIELSRLLSEHGILGIGYFILIVYIGIRTWFRRNQLPSGDVLFALYILAIATSFHAAMRTFVTPFLISICAMSLSKPLSRKSQ
jgi:hypothetical protein